MAKKGTKTEVNKMLKGLRGVNIENFSTYLQQTGVIVEPHIGRLRKRFSVPKELMGIKGENEFFKEYISSGNFSLLSKDEENALCAIEQKYFARRDAIIKNWNESVSTFKSKFEAFLDSKSEDLSETEIAALKDSVYRNIPSKEKFKDSFYMNLSLSAFPVVANLSVLDESISDEMKDSIGILAYYNEKGELSRKYHSVVSDLSKRLTKNNILKHVLIDELVKDLKKIEQEEDEDEVIEKCELVMAKIYGFAHQIQVEDAIDFDNAEMNVALLHTIFTSIETTEL